MREDKEAIDVALEKLHSLRGKEYLEKLREICRMEIFEELDGYKNIYYAGGPYSKPKKVGDDYNNLLKAASRATYFGYKVYILPNPSHTRTADFILLRHNYYRLYELKTISGKNSVDSRLQESVGQSNSVLLNISSSIKPRIVASAIKKYFENNRKANEVLIFKGRRRIIIKEADIAEDFIKNFITEWNKNK